MSSLDRFQLALEAGQSRRAELTTALGQFTAAHGATAVEVRSEPERLVALLGFDSAGSVAAAVGPLRQVATALSGHMYELLRLEGSGRQAFEERLNKMTLEPWASRSQLEVSFETVDQLVEAWARNVAEGALWVRGVDLPTSGEFSLTFRVVDLDFPGQRATVAPRPARAGEQGRWFTVTPSDTLRELIELYVGQRRQGQALPLRGPQERTRFRTRLDVTMRSLPSLARQYATELSAGGMFIRCPSQPPLRGVVDVAIALPNGATVTLPAEVVHRVESGPAAGVGVEFLEHDPVALEPIAALLATYRERRPRVLVVDDEAIWRSTLEKSLTAMGIEVNTATDGHQALVALVDSLFELDLMILDLHMPALDGLGLLKRIRTDGGELGLRIFVLSGADPAELEAAKPYAAAVFSKTDPFEIFCKRVRSELGLPE